MAEAIDEQKRSALAAVSPVVPLQPNGALPPLFLVHSADRNVMGYVSLVRHLGAGQPAHGVRDVGDDMARPLTRIAAEHVRAIRSVQPRGPYYLCGWSFGGFVAFEMALQLERAGETVAFVGLMDTMSPLLEQAWPRLDAAGVAVGLATEVAQHMRRPFQMRARELAGLDTAAQVRRVVEALHAQGAAPAGFDAAALEAQCRTIADRYQSRAGYVPGRFNGTLTLFRALEVPEHHPVFFSGYTEEEERTLGWCRHSARPVEVRPVPGSHALIASEPHVRALAQEMLGALAAARERASHGDGARDLAQGALS
jgi:thioesterase domain-containing protein